MNVLGDDVWQPHIVYFWMDYRTMVSLL